MLRRQRLALCSAAIVKAGLGLQFPKLRMCKPHHADAGHLYDDG